MAKLSEENLKKLKEKLEKEKSSVENELKNFAKEDKGLKGDWDTPFPYFDGEIGSASLEKAADEVEAYESKLPVEHTLETKLTNINLALKKMEEKNYGLCEKCRKTIDFKRLKVFPEARFCLKCQKR